MPLHVQNLFSHLRLIELRIFWEYNFYFFSAKKNKNRKNMYEKNRQTSEYNNVFNNKIVYVFFHRRIMSGVQIAFQITKIFININSISQKNAIKPEDREKNTKKAKSGSVCSNLKVFLQLV